MDELLEQFLIEARDLIAQAQDDLAALDRDSRDAARIDSAFRAIHTLKGSVAIFDMAPMGAVLHAAEDLLGGARTTGELAPAAVSALVEAIDQSDRWVDAVEAEGELPADASRDALRLARSLAAGGAGPDPETEAQQTPDWVEPLLARERAALPPGMPLTAIRYVPDSECFFRGDDPLALLAGVPDLLAVHVGPREPWAPLAEFDPFGCNLAIEAVSASALAEVRAALRLAGDQVELAPAFVEAERTAGGTIALEGSARTLRVDAGRIDRLLALVGELSVAKNRLVHLADTAAGTLTVEQLARELRAEHGLLDRLTTDLHAAVMGVRTTPLERTFRRLPRLAREIAEQLGREITVHVSGEATELDKTIVDSLFEPLLHLVRNAIDHGIEAPEVRDRTGKPRAGRISLEARRTGDQVEIAVADDGAGIDPARIRQVAAGRGLPAADLDDDAAIALIFAPGFSTAGAVTDISGRGVGMDAVRIAVERLGGAVSVASRIGEGTTIRLRLPLNAVMATILTVDVGGERFGVPMEDVVEIVRVPEDRVRPIGQGAAFALRDNTVPIVQLAELLARPVPPAAAERTVLIARMGDERIGIAVDGVSSRFTALLRPMAGFLGGLPGVGGTTLLGDGSVLLVLDLPELVG